MKKLVEAGIIIFFGCVLSCGSASAQVNGGATVAPGSSLPGLGPLALGLDGPGYIEVGGSHSSLTAGNPDWNDFYARGMLSGGRNILNLENSRAKRVLGLAAGSVIWD